MQEPGGAMQLPVFSEGHLLSVNLVAVEDTRVMSDVIEITQDAEWRRVAERDALRVNISATHLDPTARAEDLVLLGMQGELAMLVDREWRTPLQIRGHLPNVGELVLRLTRIELLNR